MPADPCARSSQPLWRQPPYEYEHDKLPIDILAGSPQFRQQIEAGTDARQAIPAPLFLAPAHVWKCQGGSARIAP